jgi:hypothetical protein
MNTQPPLTTHAFAQQVGVLAQSVRVRLCRTGSYFGIRPLKTPSGRLLWPADGPQRLIEEATR